MTRIHFNALRQSATIRDLLAWGKNMQNIPTNIRGDLNTIVFATVLIVCSLAVGCSSEKPKPVNSKNQIPQPQVQSPFVPASAPVTQAENKLAHKKVVHRKPATVNYSDKNYGVSFEYPRRYALDTGDAAADVVMSNPVPMNFVQSGGIALAAVELPETGFANTDFSSAFFGVSVNKTLTADQCNQFAVPVPKMAESATPAATDAQSSSGAVATESTSIATPSAPTAQTAAQSNSNVTAVANTTLASDSKSDVKTESSAQTDAGSKLMLGNLELRATEAVSGEGTRQSDAKYFHVYQNGACYEFALNVTTIAEDGLIKHVDRDRVFDRLERILATVKIDELKPATQDASAAPTTAQSPAK
jgi:hypothetical protein